jgi:hypothetical protein
VQYLVLQHGVVVKKRWLELQYHRRQHRRHNVTLLLLLPIIKIYATIATTTKIHAEDKI